MHRATGLTTDMSPRLRELLSRTATEDNMTRGHWEALAEAYGPEVYSEAFYALTRTELSPEAARERLFAIVARQEELTVALSRPVSLITAASDCLSQMDPPQHEPVLVDAQLLRHKDECAYRDELTGLFNRRLFNLEVPREIERFRRFGQSFSLLMLDLDQFKAFNDAHGHSAGDQALRDVASILLDSARLYDRVVRYGGEEFAVILPQTGPDEALAVAERMRAAMEAHSITFAGQDLGAITVSVGLSSFPKDALDVTGLVQSADQALYMAKEQRNCVRQYRDTKRIHRRYALSDPLPLRVEAPGVELVASAQDISLGGLSLSAGMPLPPATRLHLVLSDASRSIHLPIAAEVRRVGQASDNSFHMGLSFRLDSVEDQMKLMALLDGRLDLTSIKPDQLWHARSA